MMPMSVSVMPEKLENCVVALDTIFETKSVGMVIILFFVRELRAERRGFRGARARGLPHQAHDERL